RRLAPGGVDVYFDNVGGEVLDAVLTRLARGARIVISGAVSQYNEAKVLGPALPVAAGVPSIDDRHGRLPLRRSVSDRLCRARPVAACRKVDVTEHVVDGGVRAFPEVLLKLFAGENTGKLILRT
ncbi:MAG: hypothetical protein QOI25_176, partial [Mycobacterium sp.]|nr:hypothetical protein [Mycobacterium sp.]